jgi:hypothetical protein
VQLLSQHYVSLLLDRSIPSKDLYCRLWLTLTAHATVLLLRCGCRLWAGAQQPHTLLHCTGMGTSRLVA